MINTFKNVKSPKVLDEIDVYTFMDMVKSPEKEVLLAIEKARNAYKNDEEELYVKLKEGISCFTLNFSFYDWRRNDNIKAPSGFIYIDLDNIVSIDLTNPYIFCTWKSLSNYGRGILVRVKNLSKDNFRYVYKEVSELLGIESDIGAKKASQPNIHSYDPDLFYNEDSITFKPTINMVTRVGNNNSPITLAFKKREVRVAYATGVIRFNNLHTIDFEGKDYVVFEEKQLFAKAFIPKSINRGSRNTYMSSFAHQIIALNLEMPFDDFCSFIININRDHCKPPLKDEEIMTIVKYKYGEKEKTPILNYERRLVFNPKAGLSKIQKNRIKGKIIGGIRMKKSIAKIEKAIDNWSFEESGKITQKSLQEKTGKCIKTIERHYKHFKERISSLNSKLKNDDKELDKAA
ncbi:BT4734/BF3469 family protein [Aequorivita antarctica]|uniref:Uncharacterized protein n=1 Tax=Aequorivita antarctica TaxID=153266 RepID=A0A5C6Z1P7_9FLAO|nr:BT4734/BF3469 family protein [Aequorivita antarctica]TXD73926.1 hypothetical protein ESU54_05500 [Aequorivita antarctica]SRX73354.1 hypothetical protein AEQU3_00790 [Aequorivita antarctica]